MVDPLELDVVQVLGLPGDGRGAVDEDDDLGVRLVPHLDAGARLRPRRRSAAAGRAARAGRRGASSACPRGRRRPPPGRAPRGAGRARPAGGARCAPATRSGAAAVVTSAMWRGGAPSTYGRSSHSCSSPRRTRKPMRAILVRSRAASLSGSRAFGVAVDGDREVGRVRVRVVAVGQPDDARPGAAVAGGAAAAVPSTSAFVAVPQPTPSTSAPVASRTPTAPPVPARPVANDWSAVAVPA